MSQRELKIKLQFIEQAFDCLFIRFPTSHSYNQQNSRVTIILAKTCIAKGLLRLASRLAII